MSSQSFAENLFPLADASATQPRSKPHSPFSPLVGWFATWWSSENEDREAAKTNCSLGPDLDLFASPINPSDMSNARPTIHTTDTSAMALRDDDASETCIPLVQSYKDGLTKEEFDYVVNSLLEYLEEAELASPESGREEYAYYAPENAERRLRHGVWYVPFVRLLGSLMLTDALRSPESPIYLMHDSEDGDNLCEAETPEMGEAYKRQSLELARTTHIVPIYAESVSGLCSCVMTTANYALCSSMTKTGIHIASSLSSKAWMNDERLMSRLECTSVLFRSGLLCRV